MIRSRKLTTPTVLGLLLFVAVTSHAAALPTIREEVLDNGLKILVLEDHKAPTATFQVWYRVGGQDDPGGLTGMSHLLEHMMFKGTESNGPKTFSQTIQRAGGADNAFTSQDHTGYFQLLSSDRLGIAVGLEADRMANLLLRPEDLASEREVVKEERRLRYEDDPQSLVYEEVMAAAFKTHPYRRPVIGWMADLDAIARDDIFEHYKTYYAPNNAVVLVVGDVDGDLIVERVKETFGKIPPGSPIRRLGRTEAPQPGPRRVWVKKEAELPYILSVYKTPTFPDPDAYALDVLSTILSGGSSSRLNQTLVRQARTAVSAWAGYDGLAKGPGLFYLGGTAAPGKKIEEVESGMLDQVKKIQETPPGAREVEKARNQTEASFVMEQDSIYMQARTLGSFEMAGGWRMIADYLDGIRGVTPEDVQRVAAKYLVEDARTTGVLVPVKGEPAAHDDAKGEK